jgi:chemotaxis protein methyltransferase CheR
VEQALREACGITLSEGLRGTLGDAFGRAAREAGVDERTFAVRLRAREPRALTALVEASVIGETYFFRHPEQFDALRALALEPARDRALAIWSAGCASGEEPYSLAMALEDAGRGGIPDRIVATDVSERALAVARAGEYGAWSLRRIDPALRERHFDGAPPRVRVRAALRERVEFRRHNLVTDPAPGERFDLVVCRNVLIYFTPGTAAEVAARLYAAVAPGGLLVLGPVESAAAEGLGAERIELAGGSVYRRPGPGAAAAPRARQARAERGEPRRATRKAARGAGGSRHGGRHGPREAPQAPAPARSPDRAPAAAAGPATPAQPPAGAPGTLDQARAAARCGDLETAERMAREAAARDLSPEAYLLASMAADARGDMAGAVDAIRRALYLDPGLAMGHAALVPLYARLGLADESARARRNALEAIEGLDDGAPLRGVETITAGALRSALGERGPAPARAAGSDA